MSCTMPLNNIFMQQKVNTSRFKFFKYRFIELEFYVGYKTCQYSL